MIRHAYLLVAGASLLGLLVSGYAHVPRTIAEALDRDMVYVPGGELQYGMTEVEKRLAAEASGVNVALLWDHSDALLPTNGTLVDLRQARDKAWAEVEAARQQIVDASSEAKALYQQRPDAEIKDAAKGHAAAPSAVSNYRYKLRTRLTAGASGG